MDFDYIILSMMSSFINDLPLFFLSKMELIREQCFHYNCVIVVQPLSELIAMQIYIHFTAVSVKDR